METLSEASRSTLQEQQRRNQEQSDRPPAASAIEVGSADIETDPEAATTHLARFEFSSDGSSTKILMVEWVPPKTSTSTGATSGGTSTADPESFGWDIAWPGKSTNLPANDSDSNGSYRRVFFLLPPDAPIPATVTITPTGGGVVEQGPGFSGGRLEIKPLPAIFPAGFDQETGSRGVLHTLWAKRRLAELDKEMDAELRKNAESVGLEMALAEKQWITDNFLSKPIPSRTIVIPASGPSSDALASPISPRSPGGRLGEKLKGLRLATTAADLVPSPTANTFTRFGPRAGDDDIAVSSMSAISQSNRASETASLDAAIRQQSSASGNGRSGGPRDEEDDLFALPLSPRSPDMKKSPFSMLK
ncbi:hypothetical protein LIA77_02608 [Sarocladium implicatum]|nr:hypothetical protein LIA77_02608 [Sarocladium implicatum]